MLRTQLIAAIGREVTPADFAKYMVHHQRKLYMPAYAPQPFCFAVRQPERSPEGVVAIETAAQSPATPVHTIRRTTDGAVAPMSLALDAATRVTFYGERHLHCYLD